MEEETVEKLNFKDQVKHEFNLLLAKWFKLIKRSKKK